MPEFTIKEITLASKIIIKAKCLGDYAVHPLTHYTSEKGIKIDSRTQVLTHIPTGLAVYQLSLNKCYPDSTITQLKAQVMRAAIACQDVPYFDSGMPALEQKKMLKKIILRSVGGIL